MVLPQFAHYLCRGFEFWVNICGNQWSLVFVVVCARLFILQQNNRGSKLHCSSLIMANHGPTNMANHEPTIMANQNNKKFGAKMQSRERNRNF